MGPSFFFICLLRFTSMARKRKGVGVKASLTREQHEQLSRHQAGASGNAAGVVPETTLLGREKKAHQSKSLSNEP